MQTSYDVLHAKGAEGMMQANRLSRPLTLPQLEQITELTSDGGGGTDDLVVTIVDDETGESYSFTATGSATEATVLANALAAFALHDKLPMLFDLVDGGTGTDVVLLFTAKHANRSYTFSATGGPAGVNAAVNTQEPGGTGIEFGRFVARGSEDRTFASLAATSEIGDVMGVLGRTDANHFRLTDGDTPSSSDSAERGRTYSIMERGRFLALCEGAVAPGDRVFVRRATTSGAGSVGRVRASAAGSAQVNTFAPSANLQVYGLHLAVKDADGHVRDFDALYRPTDGTTAVADAIDGLYDALVDVLGGATSATNGLGVTITESDTLLTITTDAGVEIVDLSSSVYDGDTEVVTGTAVVGTADVDTLDISRFASFEDSGTDELVWVKVDMGAQ